MSNQNPYDDGSHDDQLDRRAANHQSQRQAKRKERRVTRPPAASKEAGSPPDSFPTTYQPSKYEGSWLMSSLQPFFEQLYLADILAMVKGGKEASVYRCLAYEGVEPELLAAKVYRPRMFRSLSNDAMYREGRATLSAEGRAIKNNDNRTMRAVGKKTTFGENVAHTSWLMYEFTTLQTLYAMGAAVPQPIASAENAILMAYLGDEHMAAPPLSEISLEADEAEFVFNQVIDNIELMLRHGMIHGDLSAYNILYWDEKPTLIDFPQVTNLQDNRSARLVLSRDIDRVCTYFARQGIDADADKVMDRLWKQYGADSAGNVNSFANGAAAENLINAQEEAEAEADERRS